MRTVQAWQTLVHTDGRGKNSSKEKKCTDPWAAFTLPTVENQESSKSPLLPVKYQTERDRGSCAGDPALIHDFFRQCKRATGNRYLNDHSLTPRHVRSSVLQRDSAACIGAILTPLAPNISWSLYHRKDHKAYARASDRYPAIDRLLARHSRRNLSAVRSKRAK